MPTVPRNLASFEDPNPVIGMYSTFPNGILSKRLITMATEMSDEIVDYFRVNTHRIDDPYGYSITNDGWTLSRIPKDFKSRNELAHFMISIGFDDLQNDIVEAFSEWTYAARDFPRTDLAKIKEWVMLNAMSSLSLFVLHTKNLFETDRALIQNIVSSNSRVDALGRPNNKPTLITLSKLVTKNLGWKGGDTDQAQKRAEMLLSLSNASTQATYRSATRQGIDFENECLVVLEKCGFEVRKTPVTGDFGADLLASIDGISFAIQCKSLNKPVGVKAVQEALGAKGHYSTDFGCVCADSGFTDAALQLAATNRIITSTLHGMISALDRAA